MKEQKNFLLFAIPLFGLVFIIIIASMIIDSASSKARTHVYTALTEQGRVHAKIVDHYTSCRKHNKVLEAGLDHHNCMAATSDFILQESPYDKATKKILKNCDIKLGELDNLTSKPMALALNHIGFY